MDEPPPRDMNRPTRSVDPPAADSANAETVPDRGSGVVTRPRARQVTGAFDPPACRFETRGELGRGGMGAVIDAYDTALKRPVAIKQVLETSPDTLARFEREAQITALLEHPGIVPIHDAGREADGTPYYVMRRIDGEPLEKLVDRRPFADRIARVPNVLAACDAAAFAHSRGVIHRDIKPANILIGPFGETLLIDWGLARRIDDDDDASESRSGGSGLTRIGSVAGTPGFMSPEQARAEPLDARADVFALGATLFYVLSGRLAFSASGATEMIDHIGTGKPPDWRRLPEETPPELRAIIEKAMAFDGAARYADAGELATDLRHYVTGQLVGAYRYGWLEQVRRFVRRHRAAVAVALIAIVVIVAGATISVRRVINERDDARRARAIAEANQREANAKRDQLIVEKALKLAETEPAAAIATLRRLPRESTEWRRAASAAAAAAARGIPFGFSGVVAASDMAWLVPAPDSRQLLVNRMRDGRLTVIDVVARTRTELGAFESLDWMTWLDDRTVAGATRSEIHLIDIPTRAVRRLAAASRPAFVVADREGRGFVQTADGKVFAITSATTKLDAPVVEGVTAFLPISGGRAIVHRAESAELWPANTKLAEGVQHVIVARDRVAIRTSREICTWDVKAAPARELCFPAPDTRTSLFALTKRGVFVMGIDGLAQATMSGPNTVSRQVRAMNATPQGFVFSPASGAIEVWDDSGPFDLRAGGMTDYRTIVQTPDQRFVAALAATGDLLIWDLPTFRPQTIELGSRSLLGLSHTGLWTFERFGDVYRYDRKTGEDTLRVTGFVAGGVIDLDERWLLTSRPVNGAISSSNRSPYIHTLYNLETRARIVGGPAEALGFTPEGAFAIDGKGTITLIGDDGTRQPVGAFPATAIEVGADGDTIAMITAAKEVCRFSRVKRAHSCRKLATQPDLVAVDRSGTVWLLGNGELTHWDADGEVRPAWPAMRFGQFVWIDHQIFAAGTTGLVNLGDPTALPVAFPPMLSFVSLDNGRVAGLTASRQHAVIDVKNGITYHLSGRPSPTVEAMHSDGASVAAMRSGPFPVFVIYNLSRPMEPEPLRAWLDQVTNARRIGDSDVVAWP
ncbi:MAG TPA: protein kinase [Kofleriaceae bacterium]